MFQGIGASHNSESSKYLKTIFEGRRVESQEG